MSSNIPSSGPTSRIPQRPPGEVELTVPSEPSGSSRQAPTGPLSRRQPTAGASSSGGSGDIRPRAASPQIQLQSPGSEAALLTPSRIASPGSPLSLHVMTESLENMAKASLGVRELAPDAEARIAENTALLRERGFGSAESVRQLLTSAWKHDVALAAGAMGLTGNAGYAIGMEAASEKLVAKLPVAILRNPSQLGMLVGLGVGGLDVAISVLGKAAITPLIYNGADGNARLPNSIKVPGSAESMMSSLKFATAANLLKNLPRIPAPEIQAFVEKNIHGVNDNSIVRLTADRVDTALDAGLGFAASMAVQIKNLSGGVGYDARMLLRDDLGAVLDKMQGSYANSALNAAKGVGSALMQPAVPLAVVATIGVFISQLFAVNSAIDSNGHASLVPPLPNDRANALVMTEKRASSVMMMGLMTAAIELGAPVVGAASSALASATKNAASTSAHYIADAAVAGAGKAKEAAIGAKNFVANTAAAVPNLGAWVAQTLHLQAPPPAEHTT